MPAGSSRTPIALRAARPRSSPYTSTTRSVNPLTTDGWSPKPSAERTNPSTASRSSGVDTSEDTSASQLSGLVSFWFNRLQASREPARTSSDEGGHFLGHETGSLGEHPVREVV